MGTKNNVARPQQHHSRELYPFGWLAKGRQSLIAVFIPIAVKTVMDGLAVQLLKARYGGKFIDDTSGKKDFASAAAATR